jgi:hypothetical protein
MNENLTLLERNLETWGDGDRSQVPPAPLAGAPGSRTVMVDRGVGVNLPLLGVHVGGRPRYVVTDDGPPVLTRQRLHPNSHGSKKSLERELAAARTAMNYLMEDGGVSLDPHAAPPARSPAGKGQGAKPPVPNPPDSGLGEPVKILPQSAKKSAGTIPAKK